jgi:hypothetical protein
VDARKRAAKFSYSVPRVPQDIPDRIVCGLRARFRLLRKADISFGQIFPFKPEKRARLGGGQEADACS